LRCSGVEHGFTRHEARCDAIWSAILCKILSSSDITFSLLVVIKKGRYNKLRQPRFEEIKSVAIKRLY
jgi:hypothetical protein